MFVMPRLRCFLGGLPCYLYECVDVESGCFSLVIVTHSVVDIFSDLFKEDQIELLCLLVCLCY